LPVASHDDHANLFPMPESEKVNPMIVTYGQRCLDLSESLNRPMSLARTLLASSVWKMAGHLSKYALTWKMKGTRSNRLLFQLRVSVRGTGGTGCGLLATPATVETDNRERVLAQMEKGLTLKSRKGGDNIQNNLTNQITMGMLPPPTTRDHKGTGGVERIRDGVIQKDTIDRVVEPGTGGKLSPEFVEWVMGFPIGWTDIQNPQQPSVKDEQND